MAAELVACGLTPIGVPCVELVQGTAVDLARARAACEEADLIVLASTEPLRVLWPKGSFPDVPAAVVGPATATTVAKRGGTVQTVGDGSLRRLVRSLDLSDLEVAIPHAWNSDPLALAELADGAKKLTAVPVYSMAPRPPRKVPVDGAVFVSPYAVHGWALARGFDGIQVAGVGSSTVSTLHLYGRDCDIRSRKGSYSDVAEGLASLVTG